MAERAPSMSADEVAAQVQALYEATQQAAMSEPVVTLARELRARINPVAADSAPGQGSPRTAHRPHHAAPGHAPQTHQQHAREVGPAVQTPCRWPTNGL